MPFTFKLSKRLARLKRAATLALLAGLVACELRVVDPSLRVQPVVVPTSVILEPSQTQQLSAYGQTPAGDSVPIAVTSWTSSNPAVATVSAAGLVTGVAAGSATITATSEGKSGSAAISVANAPVASVVISPDTAAVLLAATLQLTATPLDANGNPLSGRPVTWASSAPAVATVSAGGLVTGVAAGTATITATSEGKNGSAAITVTAPPPPPSDPSYYVSPSGNDAVSCAQAQDIGTPRRTLNKAIECLGPGTTLYIRGGTYAEALLNNIPSGTSWTAPVTLKAYPGETVTLRPNSGSHVFHFQNGQSYIVLDSLIVDASNVSTDGIKITRSTSAAHHIRVMNSEIKNAPVQGVLISGPNTRFNELINLRLHHNGGPVGSTNYNHGIYIDSPDNLVDGCDAYNNASYGIQVYSSDGTAHNNTVRNSRSHGNNKGMVIASGDGNVAYNNLVYGNPALGLNVDYGVSNAEIYNNTLYENGTGIQIGSGSTNATVRNNLVWQSGTAYSNSGSGTVQSNNLLDTADPRFVNAAAGDFRLQSGSPAIDAGATIPLVPTDFDGVTRPRGTAYDLGAFEY